VGQHRLRARVQARVQSRLLGSDRGDAKDVRQFDLRRRELGLAGYVLGLSRIMTLLKAPL
jgi:hypothetical protein